MGRKPKESVGKTILRLAVLIAFLVSLAASVYGRSSPGSRAAASRPVHVRSYTRKDGTVVRAHDRALPGTAPKSRRTIVPRSSATREPKPSVVRASRIPARRTPARHIQRSEAAKHAFETTYPCPATGKSSGACPGYVVDHIKPLACGGNDAPGNMQWQTVADGKAKDKVERAGCGC